MSEKNRHPAADSVPWGQVSETIRLYNAWLALLLGRLGDTVIRVSGDELRDALNRLSCTIVREGDAYVIRTGSAANESGTKPGEEDA